MPEFTRLDDLRAQRPLIHCVSNLVSANDCANVALAVGASPMMARAPEEMEEITAASRATVLNTGTPDSGRFAVCLLCARAAAAAGQPVVVDPVGVGAGAWRLENVGKLLDAFPPAILRVNLGEAQALLRRRSLEQGVDSPGPASRQERLDCAGRLAETLGTAVLLTGPEDVACSGGEAWLIPGGSALAGRITGSGCMLSVLCGAFSAVEPDPLAAAVLAAALWKLCASRAEAAAGPGTASFRTALLDQASLLTAAELAREARVLRL